MQSSGHEYVLERVRDDIKSLDPPQQNSLLFMMWELAVGLHLLFKGRSQLRLYNMMS